MRCLPRWVWVLPVAGAAAASVGGFLIYRAPRAAALHRLAAEAAGLDARRLELEALPIPATGELADRLPGTLTVGTLLACLEPLARRSGVRAVSFESEDQDAAPAADDLAEPADDPDARVARGTPPDRLSCVFTVAGSFRNVVHFLGLIESAPALMRVRTLSLQPTVTEIRAAIGIAAYGYQEATAAPADAGPEVQDAPPPPDGGR